MRHNVLAPAVVIALLLVGALRPAPAREDESDPLAAMDAFVQEACAARGWKEDDLHPRHDFIAADPYRLPLVDTYLARPAAVARDARTRFRPWVEGKESRPTALARAGREIGLHVDGEPPAPSESDDLHAALLALYEGTDVEGPDATAFAADVKPLPKRARPLLAMLLRAAKEAVDLRTRAFADLSEEEWVNLRKFGSQLETGMPPHLQVQYLAGLHARVDRTALFQAALVVARALERVPALGARCPRNTASFQVAWDTPAGRVEVGGTKPNTYEQDALLVLDLGGDDVHAHSAGGTLYTPHKVSLCVDLSGNDRYETKVGLAHGAGLYGVGALLDLAGDDAYVATKVSQGAGHLGVGMLWDLAGDDRYEAEQVSQGFALQGVGWLRDEAGNDTYKVGILGQGCGSTQGIGILQDLAGNDRYEAGGRVADTGRDATHFLSLAQGHGQGHRAGDLSHCTSGGIGVLADAAGDDRYVADVFGQGCAYWYALGVLLDASGDDEYRVFNYGQGGGFHMAVGVCLDLAGDDAWNGAHHAQGHGLDRSVGWCVDFAGDDAYQAESECQGAAVKPFARAFFLDASGRDTYRGGTPGYVRIPEEGEDGPWPIAFFLDLAGTDAYETSLSAFEAQIDGTIGNGATWVVNGHGVARDR